MARKNTGGRTIFTFCTIYQNIFLCYLPKRLAVNAVGNSVDSSYSRNGSSSMSDERANSSAKLRSQVDVRGSDTEATFEDSGKE